MKKFIVIFLLLASWVPKAWSKEWDPRLIQAMELAFAANPDPGEAMIRTYIQEHPRDPNGLFVLAMVLEWKYGLSKENHFAAYPELEKIYKKANQMAFYLWEKKPEDVDTLIDLGNSYFLLARIYAKQGSHVKAGLTGKKCQKHLKKALEKDPQRLDALVSTGAFNYFAGNTPKFWEPLKRMFGIKGDKQEGLTQLQRASQGNHPYVWTAKYALLEIYSDPEKNYPKALEILEEFKKTFPENPMVPLKRAWILERQDPLQGAQAFIEFADSCSEKFAVCPPKLEFFAYSQAGEIFLKQGRYSEARKYLLKSLEKDPKNYPDRRGLVFLWLGRAAEKEKQVDRALSYYQQAREVQGISKDLSREIKKTRREACQQDAFSGKC